MAEPRTFLLDSTAVLLYFAGEKRVEDVINRVSDGAAEGYMLELCASELFSKLEEKFGYDAAAKRMEAVKNSRIKLVGADYELMKLAGQIKSEHKGKLPMTGACMLALARKLDAVIVTSDEQVAKAAKTKIEYLGL